VGKKAVAKTLKAPKTPDPTWDHYVFMYDYFIVCLTSSESSPNEIYFEVGKDEGICAEYVLLLFQF
jgi:hypothetical protein